MKLAFCNDCDLMSWTGYSIVHDYFESINIAVGDSFWLFDPSGSDMALFTHDLNHKGPKHEELLDEIRSGRLDVLHSLGSYGERFNKGYTPNRRLAAAGLEYLAKHAKVPKIWSNHGDVHNIQNIGGRFPATYHQGDDPQSDAYLVDLLRDYGVEYYWLETKGGLTRELSPLKLVNDDQCRSGQVIKRFTRLYTSRIDWSPNGDNLHLQICPEDILQLKESDQSAIIYTHWGCAHDGRWAYTPDGNPLSDETMKALKTLSVMQSGGKVEIVRLLDLLQEEAVKPISEEAQRIGSYIVQTESLNTDKSYFNQYHKWGIPYFQQRIKQLGVSGQKALDAGCGVGQWALALTDVFDEVDGIDAGDIAYGILQNISERIPDYAIEFKKGKVESLPYQDCSYDFVLCYGVIMFTNTEQSLKEIYRVLKPGGTAYINLNADGWYQYCCDVRFKDNYSFIAMHVAPIWHSFYVRAGGKERLKETLKSRIVLRYLKNGRLNVKQAKALINVIKAQIMPENYKVVIESYSETIIVFLGCFLKEYLLDILQSDSKPEKQQHSLFSNIDKVLQKTKSRIQQGFGIEEYEYDYEKILMEVRKHHIVENLEHNRSYLPDEFIAICQKNGFVDICWGGDGTIGSINGNNAVTPIYDADYKGATSVWECLITKPL